MRRLPNVGRRELAALATLALVVVAGTWYAVAREEATGAAVVDERAGTYRGVGFGDAEADVARAFGAPDRSAGFAPAGRSPADVAVPHSIDVPGVRPPALLKYEHVAFLVSPATGVSATLVAEPAATTRRGVAVGDDLDEARREYDVRCIRVAAGETLSGDVLTYPSCGASVGPVRIWFGGDPIESITVVARRP